MKFMKKICLILTLMVMSICLLHAQEKSEMTASDTIQVKSKAFSKEEKNRNVMLNAENNAGPREVNIGLPFTGDVTILENGNTVVGSFWPQNPLSVWRYDKSIGRIGLRNYQETAITTGVVGYTVDSHMREGGRKFRGFAEFKTNDRGMLRGSVNVSGPIKNDWYYSASASVSRDPGSTKLSYGDYADDSEIFKVMLTKKFAKRRGKFSIAYKHAEMSNIVDRFFPFQYNSDGSVKQIPGFDLGKDSFLPRDGVLHGIDPFTGEEYAYDLEKNNNTVSNVFDVIFDYKFKSGWKVNFSGRYHKAKADNAFNFPASLGEGTPGGANYPGWTDLNDNPYAGPVAFTLQSINDNTPVETLAGRLEFTKKINKHDLRFGANYVGYNADFDNKNNFVYMSVEKNPRILKNTLPYLPGGASWTNEYGHIQYPMSFTNFNLEYNHYKQKQSAIYFSDDIDVSKTFKLSIGGRAEYFNLKGDYFTLEERAKNPGTPFAGTPTKYDNSRWNFVASAKADWRLTSRIGILGQYTIHANGDKKDGYTAGTEVDLKGSNIQFARLGLYYNHPKLSIVSALTSITKDNLFSNSSYSPPGQPQFQSARVADTYKIQTLGWTTDVIAKPFKNFELHYLLTIQKPEYKGFEVTPEFPAWTGVPTETYDFSNTIPGMSKVLMEIDPAYFLFERKVKVWGSLRYFSETQANNLNTLKFESRWETFAGINYRVTKNLGVNVGVNNLLDQRGVKGRIQGSTLAKDPSIYDGTLQAAQMLLPRRFVMSVNYKF
eukprot:TRINITY_DN966_c1_g1_i1.p6 TRINITY_DN966_c1_g1~~TRINITY_DN966_c1_g1_i1.p6  ORF type:complete len:772 (-),score=121.49 TRINITY_DN966_c1_g1_i1:38599-40914(-)